MKRHEIALLWKLQDGVLLESQGHLLVGGESSPQACTCLCRCHPGCCAFPRVNDPLVPTATWTQPASLELRQLRILVVGTEGFAEFTVAGHSFSIQMRSVAVVLCCSPKLKQPGQSPKLDARIRTVGALSSSLWLRVFKKPVKSGPDAVTTAWPQGGPGASIFCRGRGLGN